METKKDWQDYLKALKKEVITVEKFVKKLKPGDVSTQDAGSNPPTNPPKPPGS